MSVPVGERISAVEAKLGDLKDYESGRWHKLDNDLMPLLQLPERLTREIGRLQGAIDGKIAVITKEMERSTAAAIELQLKPLAEDIAENSRHIARHEDEIVSLREARAQLTAAKLIGVFVVQTVIAAMAALGGVWAMLSGKAHP